MKQGSFGDRYGLTSKDIFLILISLVLVLIPLALGAYVIPKRVAIQNQFEKPIAYAVSDSNPTRMAERLNQGADYLEQHQLSDRDVCVFVYSPMCDTSEFYRKLRESSAILSRIANADELTISNTLIRIRESFVTSNSDGEQIGFPNGLTRIILYGQNKTLSWFIAFGVNTLFWVSISAVFILWSI